MTLVEDSRALVEKTASAAGVAVMPHLREP